jgi:U32 family peptidase
VRNLGALEFLKNSNLALIADFSLNVTNSITAEWMISKGFQTLTPSYDLNHSQLTELLRFSDPSKFEITIHQYMPTFHMEHCVFAAFLSEGTSWRDCGKPCEKHRVELRDTNGSLFPLKADAECRNTMFNGKAQSAARLLPDLLSLGVCQYRFEALFEPADELRNKVLAYLDLIQGKITISDLYSRFHILEKYGVTDGQLLSIRSYKDRKKDGGYHSPKQVSEVLTNL